jgi:hypothetical protein
MIQFDCPSCGKQISAPDEAVGKTGKCPKCGQRSQVPRPQSVSQAEITAAAVQPGQAAPKSPDTTSPKAVETAPEFPATGGDTPGAAQFHRIPDRAESRYAGHYSRANEPGGLLRIFTESGTIALTSRNPETAQGRFELAVEIYHQIMLMHIPPDARSHIVESMGALSELFPSTVRINEALGLCERAEKLKTLKKQLDSLRRAQGALEMGLLFRDRCYDMVKSLYDRVAALIAEGERRADSTGEPLNVPDMMRTVVHQAQPDHLATQPPQAAPQVPITSTQAQVPGEPGKPSCFEWQKSRAHLLFLSSRSYPLRVFRSDSSCLHILSVEYVNASTSWEGVLGENPGQAIERFLNQGLLIEGDSHATLTDRFNVQELKDLLRQRGLRLSGCKSDLIQRLLETDPKGMETALGGYKILLLTGHGREIVGEFLQKEKDEREAVERQMAEHLRRGQFKEACISLPHLIGSTGLSRR